MTREQKRRFFAIALAGLAIISTVGSMYGLLVEDDAFLALLTLPCILIVCLTLLWIIEKRLPFP